MAGAEGKALSNKKRRKQIRIADLEKKKDLFKRGSAEPFEVARKKK